MLSSNSLSGAEKVVINIIESVSDEFDLIYVSPVGPIREVLEEKNIKYISLTSMNPYSLKKLFQQLKPDIIHAHDFRASINIALTLYRCKKISHIHQNPSWMKKFNIYTLAYFITSFLYNKIVGVSDEIFKDAIFKNVIKSKYVTLTNYVNIASVKSDSLLENYKYSYDLAFVGRLSYEKDPLRFIDIVNELKIINNDLQAVIIGDGNLKNECKMKIESFKLENNITMLGFIKNPFPIVNNSKLLIVTSKWEGFGLVVVEALALGKPVLSLPVGGVRSIINKDSGIICESNNDFCTNIMKVLNDENYYEILSKGAIERAKKFGNEIEWTNKIIALYNNE